MKLLTLSLIATIMIGGSAFAEEVTSSTADKTAKSVAEVTKKPRKKKVEMCTDGCGKPESECDCHGKNKKDDTKKTDN